MGFLKRLKDTASGRILKTNLLIGNHAVRICKKLETIDNPLITALVYGASMCTIQFLESMFYEVKDFKYDDGTLELNPFKENMHLLIPDDSFVMFKSVAGNYLIHFIAEEYFEGTKDFVNVSETKRQFFTIYEYNDGDIQVFNEMFELAKKNQRPSAEMRLYDHIFEKAFKIKIPEALYMTIMFETLFLASFNETFLPGLLDALRT